MRNEEFTMQVTGGDATEVQRLWQWIDGRSMSPGGYKQLTGDPAAGQMIQVDVYRVNEHSEMFVSGEVADYGTGVIIIGNEPLLNRFLHWMTREFPTLEGHLRVKIGDATGSSFDEYLFRQGEFTDFPKKYRGYYHTANEPGFDTEPILAYELQFNADGSQDDLIRRLRANGVFIDITDPSDTLTRDEDDTDYTNPWGCQPWTVDEDLYLDALQTIANGDRTDKPGLINHVRELYDAVCRDIELTPDEISRLYDKCPADKEADYQSRASGAVFSGLEIGHIERAHLTGERLYPTARMLRHLAALTTNDARSSQLQDAIHNPRWVAPEYDWPIWRLERQYRQRWETGTPAFDEAEFTADVRPGKTD